MLVGALVGFAMYGGILAIGDGHCDTGCDERRWQRRTRVRDIAAATVGILGTLLLTSGTSTLFYDRSL